MGVDTPRADLGIGAKLHIHLQEGFEGDVVVISVDGDECLRREARSRRALALAAHETFDVDAGKHTIHVSIPGRSVDRRIDVDVHENLYVGLGLSGDEMRVRIREKPFGYG